MIALDKHHTEEQLVKRLKEKTGHGSARTLRSWRRLGIGPPWIKFGWVILYPDDAFEGWLRGQVHQPVRPRKRA